MLFIFSLFLAKFSLIWFVKSLMKHSYNRVAFLLQVLTSFWAVSGIATVAFQCQLPSPWDILSSHCLNMVRACGFSINHPTAFEMNVH